MYKLQFVLIYLYGKVKHFYMLLSKQKTTYYILLMEILHVFFKILMLFDVRQVSLVVNLTIVLDVHFTQSVKLIYTILRNLKQWVAGICKCYVACLHLLPIHQTSCGSTILHIVFLMTKLLFIKKKIFIFLKMVFEVFIYFIFIIKGKIK